MKKTLAFAVAGLSVFLAGCAVQLPAQNQDNNQPAINQNQNVNQSDVEINQNVNPPAAEGLGAVGPSANYEYSIVNENLILPGTDGWKVYHNVNYSYLFKYDSKKFDCAEGYVGQGQKGPSAGELVDTETIMENLVTCTGQCEIKPGYFDCVPPQMHIRVFPNLTNLGLSGWCGKMPHGTGTCSKANYHLAGLPAIRYTLKAVPESEEEVSGEMKKSTVEIRDSIYFSYENKNYMIQSYTDLSDKDYRGIIEAVLSSFKFVK